MISQSDQNFTGADNVENEQNFNNILEFVSFIGKFALVHYGFPLIWFTFFFFLFSQNFQMCCVLFDVCHIVPMFYLFSQVL